MLILAFLLHLIVDAPRAEDPAPASDPAAAAASEAKLVAEYRRLSGELRNLSRRQLWVGASRTFNELAALGLPLSYEDYVNGAQAARSLGDLAMAYERFSAAARIDGRREVVEWLFAIDASYGRVHLRTDPPYTPNVLSVAQTPMLPEPRLCVEFAQQKVAEAGAFDGLLPAGTYTFGDQTFEVRPGPMPVLVTAQPLDSKRPRRGD